MIYVISKSTFGSYNVRDIQCNANWDCCPYSDYALIPDNLVEDILATQGYCDITLNDAGNAVTAFTARSIPSVPDECCGINTVLSVNGAKANSNGEVIVPFTKTVSGTQITIEDAPDSVLHGLKLYGKSTQDGTPTPENPVDIVSAGAGSKNLFSLGEFQFTTATSGSGYAIAPEAVKNFILELPNGVYAISFTPTPATTDATAGQRTKDL